MDYWQHVDYRVHVAWDDFAAEAAGRRIWAFTTRTERGLWEAEFAPGDVLLFGPESRGLPDSILAAAPERLVRIPMRPETRSLNLSTSVGIALYEALRQVGFPGGR
jgi:tRNA (cytidine/uridine-2'-O-)-methyltransferase